MSSWIIGALALLVGFGAGIVAVFLFWLRLMRNPDFTRKVLEAVHRNAQHQHWLSDMPGEGNVCPCCGWREKPLPEIGPGDLCGVRLAMSNWAAIDGHDAVGTKAELEELVVAWKRAQLQGPADVLYAVRKYTGSDPCDQRTLEEELAERRKEQ